MKLILERYNYSSSWTEGRLFVGSDEYVTLERPWEDNQPFVSCIPDGIYRLHPYTRPSNGETVPCLENPDLEVYRHKADIPPRKNGRYAILIHAGNQVSDLAGCIAPAKRLANTRGKIMDSRPALDAIKLALQKDEVNTIEIINATGARL